jgi:hypothetical protein
VAANPKPKVVLLPLNGKGAIAEGHSRGPYFLPAAFSNLLKLQGWMLRVDFQQRELLVCAAANVLRKQVVFLPELRGSLVLHLLLEGLHAAVFLIIQCALNGVINATRRQIRLNPCIDALWMMSIKPGTQLGQLSRCERSDSTLNFLYRQGHSSLFYFGSMIS